MPSVRVIPLLDCFALLSGKYKTPASYGILAPLTVSGRGPMNPSLSPTLGGGNKSALSRGINQWRMTFVHFTLLAGEVVANSAKKTRNKV